MLTLRLIINRWLIICKKNKFPKLFTAHKRLTVRIRNKAIFIYCEKHMKGMQYPMLVKPWFFRIVVNTALDFLRKNKKYLYLEADILEALAPGSDDEYQDFELQKAIEKLSTINKTIIVLRFYNDFKLEEISNILNENVNTIKTILYSSLKKLRIELEERDKYIGIVNNDE